MKLSNRTIMILAAAGILVICCIAGMLMMSPSGEEISNLPVDTEVVELPAGPEETMPPLIPAATQKPVTTPPTATKQPAPTEAPVEPVKPVTGQIYTHPTEEFQIIPYGNSYDEGKNYVTFQGDTAVVDVTVFELNGNLTENTLEGLANEVMKAVLLDTEWAQKYQFTDDPVEQMNDGYVLFFVYNDSNGQQQQGSLFLQQHEKDLTAITLLTPEYAPMHDEWFAIVDSYKPGGAVIAEQPAPTAPPAQSDQVTSGFDVRADGFSFENYGHVRGMTGMTSVEMQRMFGDQVCGSFKGDTCTLKPAARRWMEQANQAMSGGHCEGMAVLSQLFYFDQEEPSNFGASRTFDLDIRNPDLQREISYWWVTQSTQPGGVSKINQSPRKVVQTLIESFQQGKNASEFWVVGIYQRGGRGGHAITPIGVEAMGGSRYDILVYDNNWPGQVRRIEVDVDRNTWYYMASTNPNQREAIYEGDARTQTLEIVAITPRLTQQACTFCSSRGDVADAGGPRSLAPQRYFEIYLEGRPDLLITDEQGRQIGYLDGELINEIPEADMDTFRFGMDVWDEEYEPVYKIPMDQTFTISVVGKEDITEPTTATITIIGPGVFIDISDIWLEPGTVDVLAVSNEGGTYGMAYLSAYTETPVVMMGVEIDENLSYAFRIQGTELTGEMDSLAVFLNTETGEFGLDSTENENPGEYEIDILRMTPDDFYAFGTSGLVIDPGVTIYLQYLNWLTDGSSMTLEVDTNNDQVIDETMELEDTSDQFYWE